MILYESRNTEDSKPKKDAVAVATPVRKRPESAVSPDTFTSGSSESETKKVKTSDSENGKDSAQPVTPKQGEQEPSSLEVEGADTAGKRQHPIGMTQRQAQWFDIKTITKKVNFCLFGLNDGDHIMGVQSGKCFQNICPHSIP